MKFVRLMVTTAAAVAFMLVVALGVIHVGEALGRAVSTVQQEHVP